MSSELYLFDNSFYSDPFSLFIDDHAQSQSQSQSHFPFEETSDEIGCNLEQLTSALLSSSPPSVELESLSLSQSQQLANGAEHSASEVKTEECHLSFPSSLNNNNSSSSSSSFSPHETALKLMQRSFSSNSFENSPNFSFRPHFDSVFESQAQAQIFTSPETAFQSGQMRRVCSTGDLQKMKTSMQTRSVLSSSSPLSAEKSFMEEANFKVGRYSAEERKEKIDRYRAKRTQRNFNKTIKYACRKTLADTRPRIRGRFARNDEAGEMPKASMYQRYEDDDDLWMSMQMEGLHEEDDERIARKGTFFNVTDCTQYQNYRY